MSRAHDLINYERKKRGIPTVYWSREMARLAQSQANYCAKVGRLVHSNRYAFQGGENLAEGGSNFTPRAIVNCWLGSKAGHREYLLSPHVRKAGVGIAKSRGKTYVAWAFSDKPPSYPDCPYYKPPKARAPLSRVPIYIRKTLLNLVIIGLLIDFVRRIYMMFTLNTGLVVNAIIMFIEVVSGIWAFKLLRSKKYRKTRPKFKFAVLLLLLIATIASFAGIQPLSDIKDKAISYCQYIPVTLMQKFYSPLYAEIVGYERVGYKTARFEVQIGKTLITKDDVYYIVNVTCNGTTSTEETKFTTGSFDVFGEEAFVIHCTISHDNVGQLLADLQELFDKEYDEALYEYKEFMHEHVWEMVAGEFGLGSISYERLQELKAKQKELEADVSKWEAIKTGLDYGSLPDDFNLDRFCRKYVDIVVTEEALPTSK